VKKATLIGLIIVAAVSQAAADGILIPRPTPILPPNPHTDVKYHHVDVEIDDPAAVTRIDQVFINPYAHEIEADYIFPLPEGAAVSRFVAWLDGRKLEGELLDAYSARRIYEDIVRNRKDPALLEYYGRGMYRVRVYPIAAHGEVRIAIEYEQTLKAENGVVEYSYPLDTEKFSGADLRECRIRVDLASFENIGAIYSPSHKVEISRNGPRAASITYSETNSRPDKDFKLFFARSSKDFGFYLMRHRDEDQSTGYFLGILSPGAGNQAKSLRKNLIFVLDSSGSMRGQKMKQALGSLRFVLESLNPADKFGLIDYDDAVRPFRETMVSADRVNIRAALEFVDKIEAGGGTNIYEALNAACSMIGGGNEPTYIIFLTDGLPTVGETDVGRIAGNTADRNRNRARLFAFGVGHDVNTYLLDRLAKENKGLADYVLPEEDIESKISLLAARISNPALTDLDLRFSGIDVDLIYPQPLPDLFYGTELIVVGRYKGSGKGSVTLRGNRGDKQVGYDYAFDFGAGIGKRDFIPLIWANRRIAYLLEQIKIHGSSPELITELIELSKKYGIVTEYTSFLVTGDENLRAEQYQLLPPAVVGNRVRDGIDKFLVESVGRGSVARSKSVQEMKTLEQVATHDAINIGGETREIGNMKRVGARGFFLQGALWVQGDLVGDQCDLKIRRFSRAYFQILERDPELGKYLSLGSQVRLKIGGRIVQIDESGEETLSEDQLMSLFPN